MESRIQIIVSEIEKLKVKKNYRIERFERKTSFWQESAKGNAYERKTGYLQDAISYLELAIIELEKYIY